jgi:hypothetical protein
VELWLFWQLGERRDSRRIHKRRAARPMENRAEIERTRPRRPKSRLVNRAV